MGDEGDAEPGRTIGMVQVGDCETRRAEGLARMRYVFRRLMDPLEVVAERVQRRLLLREDEQQREKRLDQPRTTQEHEASLP